MARPSKSGVDYFPHDVDASSRKTLFTIESRFGNNGYAFWFKLLELLGQQEGLYLDLNDDSNYLFLQSKCRVSETEANEILETLSKLGAINPELWKLKVIWSDNYVQRLSPVFLKRKVSVPERPCVSSFCDGNAQIDDIPVDNCGVSATESTQSKAEQSIAQVKRTRKPRASGFESEAFIEFYNAYPKKAERPSVNAVFESLKVDEGLLADIMYGLDRWKSSYDWTKENGQYIPKPAKWLKNRCWEDEPPNNQKGEQTIGHNLPKRQNPKT